MQGFDSSSGLVMVCILILRSPGVDREFSRSDFLWSGKLCLVGPVVRLRSKWDPNSADERNRY